MRLLVLLLSIAMPVVSFFSQRGTFGPDNGTISDQYPTLLVAAGYAFAIWGVIFLLDVVYGIWQTTGERRTDATVTHVAPWAAGGFALYLGGLGWRWIFGALAAVAAAAPILWYRLHEYQRSGCACS